MHPRLFLKNVNLKIEAGETVAVIGRSGSGKTTLLNVLAVLTDRTRGDYLFEGKPVDKWAENDADSIRLRRQTGYINQASDLLPNFTVLENIHIAARCHGMGAVSNSHVLKCLADVKLDHKADSLPSQLSGGERQRANIARAVACQPKVIFADEPTGALDLHTGTTVLELLVSLATTCNCALILVTHNPEAAAMCKRTIGLRDGLVALDGPGLAGDQVRRFIEGDE